MNAGVYAIENTINNKIYIGSSVNITQRLGVHKNLLNKQKHHNAHLQRAWNKYGASSFIFFKIESCQRDRLLELEQEAIDSFDAVLDGYNARTKAESNIGVRWTPEQRKRASLRMIGLPGTRLGHKNTPEHNAKISAAHLGLKHTPEARAKISEVQKGKTISKEHLAALIASNVGRECSPETRRRISEGQKGKIISEETKRRQSESHKGKMLKEKHSNWIQDIYRPPCPSCGGDHVV